MRLFCLLSLMLAHANAWGQSYWKPADLLGDMFPQSDRIAPETLSLDADATAAFHHALGYAAPRDTYTIYVARTGDTVDGITVFDDQIGQHEPISFAVQLTPEGRVVRQEIVTYREAYGDEVKHPRFRAQFEGKTAADPVSAGDDIRVVAGATYSSKSMAVGVKRVLWLAERWRDQS